MKIQLTNIILDHPSLTIGIIMLSFSQFIKEGAQVPKGAVTGPVRQPTIVQKQQTAKPGTTKPANALSKSAWEKRKAAMDKAIDG